MVLRKVKNRIIQKILTSKRLAQPYKRFFKVQTEFLCPICNYSGPFMEILPETGRRKHAQCPRCESLERHRIQRLVLDFVLMDKQPKSLSLLHFAPEECFRSYFKKLFGVYVTADLSGNRVDQKEDLTHLSFDNNSFDIVYASHVLEHIKNDRKALSEIVRVLKPGGVAIIPVPINGNKTIEYQEPNAHESYHFRCPGEDYYERYKSFFRDVKLYDSSNFDEKYQVYVYEDRTKWPITMPLRSVTPGLRHKDIVPVCLK